jgi:hypothetical protein
MIFSEISEGKSFSGSKSQHKVFSLIPVSELNKFQCRLFTLRHAAFKHMTATPFYLSIRHERFAKTDILSMNIGALSLNSMSQILSSKLFSNFCRDSR